MIRFEFDQYNSSTKFCVSSILRSDNLSCNRSPFLRACSYETQFIIFVVFGTIEEVNKALELNSIKQIKNRKHHYCVDISFVTICRLKNYHPLY